MRRVSVIGLHITDETVDEMNAVLMEGKAARVVFTLISED